MTVRADDGQIFESGLDLAVRFAERAKVVNFAESSSVLAVEIEEVECADTTRKSASRCYHLAALRSNKSGVALAVQMLANGNSALASGKLVNLDGDAGRSRDRRNGRW